MKRRRVRPAMAPSASIKAAREHRDMLIRYLRNAFATATPAAVIREIDQEDVFGYSFQQGEVYVEAFTYANLEPEEA